MDLLKRLFNKPKVNITGTYTFKDRTFDVLDDFITEDGDHIPRLKGFREYLKPNWADMIKEQGPSPAVIDTDRMSRMISGNMKKIAPLKNFLALYGIDLSGGSILEVGCYLGATSYALSLLSPNKIVGSDLSKYYIHQTIGGTITDENIAKQFNSLTNSRNALRKHSINSGLLELCSDISFVEDDINRSKLADSSFDLIASWEVLEHIKDPGQAFKQMNRILRPGGIMFHEYNPFFCLEGGHSLCTLEFPWGHARLSHRDFIRYTNTYRSHEATVDQSFFLNNLNRMTLSDLTDVAMGSGFDIVETIKWTQDLLPDILSDPQILEQCRKNKANVSINDLLTNKVWVLLRKRGANG